MSRFYLRAIIASFALASSVASLSPASAQDRRQNEPGQFDFYLLTLSWSPSFCDASTSVRVSVSYMPTVIAFFLLRRSRTTLRIGPWSSMRIPISGRSELPL